MADGGTAETAAPDGLGKASAGRADGVLYVGRVMHRRLGAVRHRFSYRVFCLLVDIDRLDALGRRLRLFSHNRPNLIALRDRDHGARDGSPLRPWVEGRLAEHGLSAGAARIELLCFPRVAGYVFNPISVYFCRDSRDGLVAMIYEVHNTFGEEHAYVLPVDRTGASGDAERRGRAPVLQECAKRFYVSPFIGMEATYRFRLKEPAERLSFLIRQSVPAGELLIATLDGRRRPMDDRTLLRTFAAHPAMTFKVITAIHWQALKLWLKGAPFQRRRPPAAARS